jgi:hypothetical protein
MSRSSARGTRVATPGSGFRFWPFGAKVAVLLTPALLVLLLVAWGIGRDRLHFDSAPAGWVLLGIAVLSMIPLLLVVLEGIAASGGSIEVGTVKVALTSAAVSLRTPIVPSNVTQQRGQPLTDSGSAQILDVLKDSATSDIVIVDLEDGHAWWETRLLILSAGATRLGRPRVVVFTAIQEGDHDRFVAWGRPRDLRDRLLGSDGTYRRAVDEANRLAIAARLGHAPADAPNSSPPVAVNMPASKTQIVWGQDGSLNPFLDEQLLADALGRREQEGARDINVDRLWSLFRPVLRASHVDTTERDEDWFRSALLHDDDYVAMTDAGRYVAMMSMTAIVNTVLRALTQAQ